MRSLVHQKAEAKQFPASTRTRTCSECETPFLKSFGYAVLIAPSAGEGLELASMHSVDLVFVDDFMAGMNGQGVAIEMRWLRPRAPIIMLSGAVHVPEQALEESSYERHSNTSRVSHDCAQHHC
jgi:CheY-like chemotaxis protein